MNRDLLMDQELIDTARAILRAPTTALHGADGDSRLVIRRGTIDVNDAELQPTPRNLESMQQILRPQRGDEPVRAIVRERYGLLLVRHHVQRRRRPKGLLVAEAVGAPHARHDRRPEAGLRLAEVRVVADEVLGAVPPRVLEQRVGLIGEGLGSRRTEPVPVPRGDLVLQQPHELLRDVLDDDDALGREAHLAVVDEGAEGGELHRLLEVGVLEDDEGALPAELHQDRLQVLSGGQADLAADGGAAYELDLAKGRVRDDSLGHGRGVLAPRLDQVQRALGQTGIFEELDDQAVEGGTELGPLQHDGAARGERRHDPAGPEDRGAVPRRDDQDGAHGPLDAQVEAAGVGGRERAGQGRGGGGGDLADGLGAVLRHEAPVVEHARRLEDLHLGQRLAAALHQVRDLQEDAAPLPVRGPTPQGESSGCGLDGGDGVGYVGALGVVCHSVLGGVDHFDEARGLQGPGFPVDPQGDYLFTGMFDESHCDYLE